MSSSLLPLSFNPLPLPLRSSSSDLLLGVNIFSFTKLTPKSHICFTFNKNSSEREEIRWLREEQRWLREERRWEAERETLLNEIKALKLKIKIQEQEQLLQLRREGGDHNINNNSAVAAAAAANLLLHLLKKEVNQIAESGSSASPLLLEDDEVTVIRVEEEEDVNDKEEDEKVKMKRKTLRVGSEGHEVQLLQEALLKSGFYCGEEDEEFASFSTGTEIAVKTWQSSIGVPETGIMTAELLERLLIDRQDQTSGFNNDGHGFAANSITQTPEIPLRHVKEIPEPEVFENRVFLLGENRWEDSSRLKNRNSQNQTNSKGVVKIKCITCRGVGRLMCLECDGTGEPNIEPQFLEWVGEDTKCPYCEADGYTICDSCQGTGVGA